MTSRLHSLLVLVLLLAPGCSNNNSDGNGNGSGTLAGCDGASLLAPPADLAAPGPWPVGVRTAKVGNLTVEIWYPAQVGSDAGKPTERYDIRLQLPASEAAKIPDADNPWQDCDCVRDLPLDDAHGPYPVVLFVHGTASFRHQSLHQMTHWASRGFVVVAADHPGLKLGDNTKAAIITRGLAEMRRLGRALGANDATFAGMAGIGDLLTSCYSPLGRNRGLGQAIAEGRDPQVLLNAGTGVAEGAWTSRAAVDLAERVGCELPIASQVANVIWAATPVPTAMEKLLSPAPKEEDA